jgi:hypothetical protein
LIKLFPPDIFIINQVHCPEDVEDFFGIVQFFRYKQLWGDRSEGNPDLIEAYKSSESPRFVKTHLPVKLLPKQIWTKKPKVGNKNIFTSTYSLYYFG